jgi:hypothetical protein
VELDGMVKLVRKKMPVDLKTCPKVAGEDDVVSGKSGRCADVSAGASVSSEGMDGEVVRLR